MSILQCTVPFLTCSDCSSLIVEQFEEEDDPEAGLDESSSAAYEHEEIWTPTGTGASLSF
jgi:hypothetical protein